MFQPSHSVESITSMRSAIYTASGFDLVEFLVECVNAMKEWDATGLSVITGRPNPYYDLAHRAELELKRRVA